MQDLDDKLKKTLNDHTKVTTHELEEMYIHVEKNLNRRRTEKNQISFHLALKVLAPIPVIALFWFSLDQLYFQAEPDEAPLMKVDSVERTSRAEGEDKQLVETEYVLPSLEDTMYEWTNQDGLVQEIRLREPLVEGYPDVSMTIKKEAELSPEEAMQHIMFDLEEMNIERVHAPEPVSEPLDAIKLYADEGMNWDASVYRYYFVDDLNGGSYIITQTFFLEALDGHGANFDDYISEFEINNIK
ncbi:hypothetical protein [Alkalicoccobacillus porphyridii]|uniref:DUF4367 domain-containing protein n=1 Tax=Alkalicoccobacillus porphyridii TaxID=2597270 RepID=A0A553ZXE8_9BACI|nr:hypothetical protein [Alkalicoccobacillus porphyridii]TSB46131.1 hypothetical protein FN960_12255 [Alkalicoccobacillus porphyridii]